MPADTSILYLRAAQARKADAEAARALADARKADAEAECQELAVELSRMELSAARDADAKRLVQDEKMQTYRFVGEVSSSSVKKCMDDLTVWSRLYPDAALTIIFQSPGGSVVDGLALWDYLAEMRENGHHITTVARGYAASMAGILLQAGDKRVMGKESWLLIHEASFGAVGSFGEVEDMVEWIKRIQNRFLDIFAERAKTSAAPHPISRARLAKNWHRKDWWISSDEALEWGLCDEVA